MLKLINTHTHKYTVIYSHSRLVNTQIYSPNYELILSRWKKIKHNKTGLKKVVLLKRCLSLKISGIWPHCGLSHLCIYDHLGFSGISCVNKANSHFITTRLLKTSWYTVYTQESDSLVNTGLKRSQGHSERCWSGLCWRTRAFAYKHESPISRLTHPVGVMRASENYYCTKQSF